MRTITVTRIEDIGEILDFVHDQFFEISAINFRKSSESLSIPLTVMLDEIESHKKFSFVKTWKHPIVEAELVVKNAISFSIKDEADIGTADINTIAREGEEVIIECGVPIVLRIKVSSFCIELTMTDQKVDELSRFSLW